VQKEFPLKDKDGGPNHHLKVHAFLVLESVPGSKDLLISVLLQADGQFLGKTSLGTFAEGQEILLSLTWDKPKQSFVVSSETAGTVPILSFIPFTSPGTAHDVVSPEFSMAKTFVLNSATKSCVSGNPDSQ
jgi:hypothetical protein